MADYNQVITPGSVDDGLINVVVEIPAGSSNKIEWNRHLGVMQLDRIEPLIFEKPTNYGFIPQTLDQEGRDEVDVLLIATNPLPTGVVVKAKMLGLIYFADNGVVDNKVIAVAAEDRNINDSYKTLKDVPQSLLKQIEFHFVHYKDLKEVGTMEVAGWGDIEEAKKAVRKAVEHWKKEVATIAE